jgi:hypothetical protein
VAEEWQKNADVHLKRIDDGIKKIDARLELRGKAGLNIQSFNRDLPTLAETMKSANELDIQAPGDVAEALQGKLIQADPHAPGYWPAVAQFITYRSRQAIPNGIRDALLNGPIANTALPRCYGQGRVAMLDKDLHQTEPNVWSHCVLYLDDPFGASSHSRKGDLIFQECLVVYKGGPVDEFVQFALFQNCIFLFSSESPPSKLGEAVSQVLLKSLPLLSIKIPPSVTN